MEAFLQKLGLCQPCLKRFHLGTFVLSENLTEQICPSCLNLNDYESVATEIHQRFLQESYRAPFSAFSVNLNLPICQGIRERLLFILIEEKCKELSLPSWSLRSCKDIDMKKEFRQGIAKILAPLLDIKEGLVGDLQITLSFRSEASEKLLAWLSSPQFKAYIPQKYKYRNSFMKMLSESRGVITEFLNNIPESYFVENGASILDLLLESSKSCRLEKIIVTRDSLFIAGRYRKHSRNISQSPWEEKYELSVSGIIGDYLTKEVTGASEAKFSSSGREDVDVRMLGNGRPCLLELINPKIITFSTEEIDFWQEKIKAISQGNVEFFDIAIVNGIAAANVLKDGEDAKAKTYFCQIHTKIPISEVCFRDKFGAMSPQITLHQKTPIRVLHRRANLVRTRTISNFSAKWISPDYFELALTSEAGTYIKEFVHGDFGRTLPSLGSLLFEDSMCCSLLELDVLDIHMGENTWPPK